MPEQFRVAAQGSIRARCVCFSDEVCSSNILGSNPISPSRQEVNCCPADSAAIITTCRVWPLQHSRGVTRRDETTDAVEVDVAVHASVLPQAAAHRS